MVVADGFEAPIFVGQVSTLPLEGCPTDRGPSTRAPISIGQVSLRSVGVAGDHAGAWYVATKDSLLHVSAGRVRTVATCESGGFSGVAISPDGSALFVTDEANQKIRRVEVATGEVTTLAGSGEAGDADGVGDAAQFYNPTGIAISPDGSALFVTDCNNNKIRRIEVATEEVTTIAGSGTRGSTDGVGDAAQFDGPTEVATAPSCSSRRQLLFVKQAVATSSDGSMLFVSSRGGDRLVCVAASGLTLLMSAASQGHERVVELLLQRGAEIDLQSSEGLTALIIATNWSQLAAVRRLLRAGADTTLRGEDGKTALMIAKDAGYSECVRAIEEHAGTKTSKDPPPQPHHHQAEDAGKEDGKGGDTEGVLVPDIIVAAAKRGDEAAVLAWVDGGGQVNAFNSAGFPLLQVAAGNGRERVVDLLLQRGAEINLQDSNGNTALMNAAGRGRERVVELLLDPDGSGRV